MANSNFRNKLVFNIRTILLSAAVFFVILTISLFLDNKEPSYKGQSSVEAVTAKNMIKAKRSKEEMQNMAFKQKVMPQKKYESKDVVSGEHISIVKEKGFVSVAEPSLSPMQFLHKMSEERKKIRTGFKISNSDLNKELHSPSLTPPKEPALSSGLGKKKQSFAIKAPATYKIFRTADAYNAFSAANVGVFPEADFSSQMVIMLISASQFPSRIFNIVSAEKEGGKIVVKYHINPLAAAESGADTFTCKVISKSNLPVELKQIF